jgi:DNA-binding NtrC family response regulator
MERLRAEIRRVGPAEITVHVRGETGTGKELVGRALHDVSPRAGRAFVRLNAASLGDEFFETELFGHARGAYTGAHVDRRGWVSEAEGGTLLIDEVAELTPRAQSRLLRFLEEREYARLGERAMRRADVRVVSATNADLTAWVKGGRFRLDLWHRLNDWTIVVPPLRERGDDVRLLARHFAAREARLRGRPVPQLTPEAEAALCRFAWPGNVRQLEKEVRRLAVGARGETVGVEDLSPEIREATAGASGGLRGFLRECHGCQVGFLRGVLDRHDWVTAAAAREMGITRQALSARIRRLGLRRPGGTGVRAPVGPGRAGPAAAGRSVDAMLAPPAGRPAARQ